MQSTTKIVLSVAVVAILGVGIYFGVSTLMNDVSSDYPIKEAIESQGYEVESYTIGNIHLEDGTAEIKGTFKATDGTSHNYDVVFDSGTKEVITINIS